MMGDPLLQLVEKRLQSSLVLQVLNSSSNTESTCNSSTKSPPPLTNLNTPDGSPVVHLFEISSELDKTLNWRGNSHNQKFVVITLNGSIMVYDTMFRRVLWKTQTNLERLSWGEFICEKEESTSSSLLIYSRQSGLYQIQLQEEEDEQEHPPQPQLIPSETHVGFCKPYLSKTNQNLIVPIETDKIGLYAIGQGQNQPEISTCFTFSSTVMSLKEITNDEDEEGSKYVMVTTEDGFVNVLKCEKDDSTSGWKGVLVSKLILPNQSQGICIEEDETTSIFVIGTNLKAIYLLKWTLKENILQPVGKKLLPTEGVSCLALQKGEGDKLLGAGCFDGTIRLFSFPKMTQISSISYHTSQINTLLFISEKVVKKNSKVGNGKTFLLCGASNSGSLSVWNAPALPI
ncbi:unnamed protein product [Orchesella dallaii]|uniref:Guanine nucleotide-binding protein subunit beta-like protein 1 n=1 Tax=Orchesella dallaii TaxID=48710 RepID=A0ABP1PJK0_9HEXA